MEPTFSQPFILDDESDCAQLFQASINMHKDLVVLLHNTTPVLFNKAFLDFTNTSSPKEFLREFGSLENRFVPHDNYFHAGKAAHPDEWVDALAALPESERIVSMLSWRIEPFAFSVSVQRPIPEYTLMSFTDISQDLIKRIMIEHDGNIDKESGAYDKEYFVHTAKSFQDAAAFNKKFVAITMIELQGSGNLFDFVMSVKSSIRQSDMLIRWGQNTFMLAYLVDTSDNAFNVANKLRQKSFSIPIRLETVVQKEIEGISQTMQRAENALR